MADTRFTTAYDSIDDLLDGVDIDDLGDVQTLLMILLGRPLHVFGWLGEGDEANDSLQIQIRGNDEDLIVECSHPVSVLEIARICAETIEMTPGMPDRFDGSETESISTMSDEELLTALQRSLGKVRFYNLIYGAD